MAVKWINRSIDGSAPPREGFYTACAPELPDSATAGFDQSPSAPHQVNHEVMHSLPPKVQAALEKLTRYSAGREREELRSIDQAEQLASMLASRILEDDDGARAAHSELTTCTAQEHLMQ